MSQYTVSWSMVYEADDELDAVRQAVGDLETITHIDPSYGPNFFVVDNHSLTERILIQADQVVVPNKTTVADEVAQ